MVCSTARQAIGRAKGIGEDVRGMNKFVGSMSQVDEISGINADATIIGDRHRGGY